MHYGNHPARPEIHVGDLANYNLVRGGSLPCKVVELNEGPSERDPWARRRVTIRATANRPGYRRGESFPVSPLFLSHRREP